MLEFIKEFMAIAVGTLCVSGLGYIILDDVEYNAGSRLSDKVKQRFSRFNKVFIKASFSSIITLGALAAIGIYLEWGEFMAIINSY